MLRQIAAGSLLLTAAMMLFTVLAEDSAAKEEGKKKEFSQKCPVANKKAKEGQSTAYKGGNVYFCCGGCKAKFAKGVKEENLNPLHAQRANAQLVSTGQYEQKKCPFTGGPLKKASKIAGVEVKFCCGNCKKKADGNSDQLALVFNEKAFKKAFAKKGKKGDDNT